ASPTSRQKISGARGRRGTGTRALTSTYSAVALVTRTARRSRRRRTGPARTTSWLVLCGCRSGGVRMVCEWRGIGGGQPEQLESEPAENSAPGKNRTCDLRFSKPLTYRKNTAFSLPFADV